MRAARFFSMVAATVLLTVGVFGSNPAAAACEPTQPYPVADEQLKTVVTPVGTFYLDYRGEDSIWLYEETNGVEGLQRGGAHPVFGADWDECNDQHPNGNDTVIF